MRRFGFGIAGAVLLASVMFLGLNRAAPAARAAPSTTAV